jgi:hypothetical protein
MCQPCFVRESAVWPLTEAVLSCVIARNYQLMTTPTQFATTGCDALIERPDGMKCLRETYLTLSRGQRESA